MGSTMWWVLFILSLRLAQDLPTPIREKRYVPEDFNAPLELPENHFGLVDDYGLAPRFVKFRTHVTAGPPVGLSQVGKSKRDKADLDEYYYDDNL